MEPNNQATPPTDNAEWAKYIGHIVRREEDGTSWFVKSDGRHWIPDGATYAALQQKGAQVFNLPRDERAKIPDRKGDDATADSYESPQQ